MNDPIKISVILCTYNRSHSLRKSVVSVAVQELPQSLEWEILVVDNNSNDDTSQVVEELQRQYPERIRYFFEPKQGISHARNAGIAESRAEILAFIDDDETAGDTWLQNLTANLHTGEWAGAGGRVLPPSSFSRPRWLSSQSPFTQGPLASFDPENEAGKLTEPPFGANMAFRKEVFEKLGGFRTDLGRSGSNLLSNEDTEFGRRIFAAGMQLRYEPDALTYHPVEKARLQPKYFRAWWFNKGRSDVLELGVQPKGTRLLGVPVRLFRDAAVEAVRWAITLDSPQRFICSLKIWAYAGQAYESYLQGFDSNRKGLEPKTGD
jgi:glycosyltransferase involved in cell wall biosynthesis